jgi:hypothetical protein
MITFMRRYRSAVAILMVGSLAFTAAIAMPAFGGPSLTKRANRALKVAKRADKKSTKALKLAQAPGPQGPQGAAGPAGPVGPAGTAGKDGASAFSGPAPSGAKLYGTFAIMDNDPGAVGTFGENVPYGVVVPALPTYGIGSRDHSGATSAGIETAVDNSVQAGACNGTYDEPTAPAGMVCIYLFNTPQNVAANSLTVTAATAGDALANRIGFDVRVSAGVAGSRVVVDAVWAYTAP